MKYACHKNTLHINLPGPLVKTLALINHDLSENESVDKEKLFEKLCPVNSELAGCSVWNKIKLFVLTESTIVHCWLRGRASVLLTRLPGQMP